MRGLLANALNMKSQRRTQNRNANTSPGALPYAIDDYETQLLELQKSKQKTQRDALALKAAQRRDTWLDIAKNSKDFAASMYHLFQNFS